MNIAVGTKLGPYEILSPLGAGGMGEVYRARDTRLGREVAVKVLPQHLSANAEVRTRFEREAKTVSSLNHPHICTLHDIGREGDTDYLVMELIEGETLATRLAKGALPTSEVLKLGEQVADALDRAHRAGVVHRDLKPGNVMLTRSGAKLMDFGLARATGLAAAPGSGVSIEALTQSPTMAQPLTAEGTIVGTFQYMSPEQLEGKEADARSDLWALGCVLYEMATGRRAFEGKSQASLIGAIMNTDPQPVSQLAPMAPPALDRLVKACLAKDPADRVQSAHDVKLQLAWLADGAMSVSGAAAPARASAARRPRWPGWGLAAVAASAATALVMALLPRGRTSAPAGVPPQRYVVARAHLQPQATPVFSPDGTYIVLAVREAGTPQLYRRDLSSFEMTPIDGTEDGTAPFFSPDGRWIGFVTPSAVKKVPAGGGVAQLIAAEPEVNSCDWGEDGLIYFTPHRGGRDGLTMLARLSETGGKAEVVAALDTTAGEFEAWLPEILGDGKTVLVTLSGGAVGWQIVAVRPDGSRQPVVENALLARYVRSGHLIYLDLESEAVLAAPFDPAGPRITGPALPLTEEVDFGFCFDVRDDGKLLYVPQPGAGGGEQIVWLDRGGAATPALDMRAAWAQPRVSPDGRRIVLRKVATDCELWIVDLERGSLARVAPGNDNHDPVWSPDGRRVAVRRQNPPVEMIAFTVEGAREVTTLAHGASTGWPSSWSAGGDLLVYTTAGRTTQSDIWVRAMGESSPPAAFLATKANETQPAISPDGKWIAYVTNETGTPEVFVRPYPDTGVAWQVSTGGGSGPLWSRSGRELYFASGTKMMAAPIATQPVFRIGNPVELFDGGFAAGSRRDYDIAPDGRFIAVGRTGDEGGQQELRMLLNWPEAMRRVGEALR